MAVQPKTKFSLELERGRNDIFRFGPFELMDVQVHVVEGGTQVDIKLHDKPKKLYEPPFLRGKIYVEVYVMEDESAGHEGVDDGAGEDR